MGACNFGNNKINNLQILSAVFLQKTWVEFQENSMLDVILGGSR
jgi:hypothetical protein